MMDNVVKLQKTGKSNTEVVVMHLHEFEETLQAIQALQECKSVLLNLTMMVPDQAQRAVDFVAGGTYSIKGNQEQISKGIFLFTPSCVQLNTHSVY